MNVQLCEGRVLMADRRTYLEMYPPVEKDYEYVVTLDENAAYVSFYEELGGMGSIKYMTHTERFKFGVEVPMTTHIQSSFLAFFEDAFAKDAVDIRKAVRAAVNETTTYVSLMSSVV